MLDALHHHLRTEKVEHDHLETILSEDLEDELVAMAKPVHS